MLFFDRTTIGIDIKSRTVKIARKRVKILLLDTAGQERFIIFQTYTKSRSIKAHSS